MEGLKVEQSSIMKQSVTLARLRKRGYESIGRILSKSSSTTQRTAVPACRQPGAILAQIVLS